MISKSPNLEELMTYSNQALVRVVKKHSPGSDETRMAIHELLRRNRKLRAIKKRLADNDYTLDDLRDWWQFLSSYESSSADGLNHTSRNDKHRFYIWGNKSRKHNFSYSPTGWKPSQDTEFKWWIRSVIVPIIIALMGLVTVITIIITSNM